MISRRDFLKLAGLSTVAFTAGIKLGNFVKNSEGSHIYLTAFLPENDLYLNFVLQKFLDRVESYEGSDNSVKSLRKIRFAKNLLCDNDKSNDLKRKCNGDSEIIISGDCLITFQTLNGNLSSDIFLKDDKHSIYQPDEISELFFIRDEILNQQAKYKLICEYKKENLLDKFLQFKEKKVIVEVDNDIVEEIPISKTYKQISVNGSSGKIHFSVQDGKVFVTESSCRNKLCVHSGLIENLNQNIVCAPNKVIIRIGNA